jgi:hypothetical protein
LWIAERDWGWWTFGTSVKRLYPYEARRGGESAMPEERMIARKFGHEGVVT